MTTAYTSLLGLALPVTGELSGTWGSVVNDSITSLVDTSVAGTTNISTDANVTLTTTTGASNQARQAILLFSGARTAIRTVTAPAQSKIYTVINATTGGFAVTLVGAGPTTGVTIANGARTVVAWNGSDFVEVSSPSSIILPGGTANGVLYLNGSKVVTSGSALTFDGSGKLALGNVAHTSFIPTTVLTLGNSGENAEIRMGQADTKALISKWVYNATVGSAYGAIETYGQANYIQFGASDFRWQVASSEQMRLTSTGLGIGTSSPAYKLEVNGQIGCADNFVFTTANPALVVNSGYLRFFTGGSERMRLDSSGNLGLGVTPSAWGSMKAFQINGYGSAIAAWNTNRNTYILSNAYYDSSFKYSTTGAATYYNVSGENGSHSWHTAPSGTAGDAITFTQAMTLDASGNLGLGTTSPSSVSNYGAMTINGTNGGLIDVKYGNTLAGRIVGSSGSFGIEVGGTSYFNVYTNGSERARIDSSGNLLVGTTSVPSGGQKMNIAGGITPNSDNAYIFGNSGLRWQALYAANGSIQTSDEREKTDIIDSPLGLDFITSLRPVAYKFKVGKNEVLEDGSVVPVAGTRQHFGLLAQDVKQKVGNVDFGGWILTDTTDAQSAQGLRYDEFISPLIKAIQELKAEFDAYKASHP